MLALAAADRQRTTITGNEGAGLDEAIREPWMAVDAMVVREDS